MRKEPRILIVDDDESTSRTLSLVFGRKGYDTETATTGQEAIERAQRRFFNLALLDIKLPDMEGVDLLAHLRELHPDMVMIMATAYASLETAVQALNEGASAYVTKPLNMDEVLATVREALEKQRLAVENRRRNEELAALNAIAVAASQSLELGALLPLVCESLVRVTDYEAALLYLVDEEAGEARLRAQCGVSEEFAATAQVWKLGEALTGQVAQSGEPIVGDYATDDRVPSLARSSAPPWHSFAIVPIQARGRVIGTVNLASQQRFDISADDIALLETITGQIGVAIDNAQLYEAARRRASRLEALNTVIAVAAAAVSDLPDLLEVALDHALQALGLEMGVIWLLDTPGTPASLRIVRGLSPELNAEIGLAVPPVAQAAGMDIPEPRAVEDWQSVDDRLSALGSVMGRVGIRASLTVPITSAGLSTDLAERRRIGGLSLAAHAPRRWPAEEVALVEAIGQQLGGAAERLRLLQEARAHAERMGRLASLSEALNRPMNFAEVVAAVGQGALELGDADRGAVYVRNPDDAVSCPWAQGLSPAYVAQVTARVQDVPGGQLLDGTEPVLIPDVAGLPEGSLLRNLGEAEGYRAVGLWPLVYEGRTVAAAGCYYDVPHRWTATGREAMGAFARQAAVALRNAQLYDETRRRLAELSALFEVSRALRGAETVGAMLPIILDKTLAVIGEDTGAIFLLDNQADRFVPSAAAGRLKEMAGLRISREGSSLARCLETGQPQMDINATSMPEIAAVLTGEETNIQFPLQVGEVPVGVLHLCISVSHDLDQGQVRLLTTIADMAASAIHRATLHEQTEQRLRHITALRNIDMAISASLDLRVTLNVLLDQVTSQLGIHAADVLLLNPRTHTLEYAAGRGFRSNAIQQTHLRLGEGHAGRAALERRIIAIADLRLPIADWEPGQAAFQNRKSAIENLKSEEFITYHAAPLIAKGQVKGVLEIFHRTPLDRDPEWLDLLEALAAQAAIAIDNAALFDDLQRSNVELALAYDATLKGWAHALEMRDVETAGHTRRVTEMAERLARMLGMSKAELVHVRRGALLHDIGKMGIPDSILHKPGPLDDCEWDTMRQHPVYAYELLSPITYLHPARDIPYCHHEKWDGSGYPRGLKGEQIPLAARVFAVVDVWDALLSDRPYRPAWEGEKVLAYIREQAGKHFDPQVVEVFLEMVTRGRGNESTRESDAT